MITRLWALALAAPCGLPVTTVVATGTGESTGRDREQSCHQQAGGEAISWTASNSEAVTLTWGGDAVGTVAHMDLLPTPELRAYAPLPRSI
jgi:hypothetical protein